MVQYKWIALTNTCMATIMAAIDINIVLIALPAIFNGIQLDPFSSFQYLLWIMFGYSVVTATMLVSFGRLSDMFGRVKLYNLGFAIFTAGSILLSITPSTGSTGAMEIIIFRVIQGVGGAFIFSNSAAIITDAFPEKERGRALGINNLMFLIGSIVGLTLGGILAAYNCESQYKAVVTSDGKLRLKDYVLAYLGIDSSQQETPQLSLAQWQEAA